MADRAAAGSTGRLPRAGVIGAALAVIALVGFPLAELLAVAGEQGGAAVRAAVTRPGTVRAVVTTMATGGVVTLVSVGLGTAAALATERTGDGRRRWLRRGLLAPLVVPPFVAALGWAQAYGPGGLSDDLLGAPLPGVYGAAGVVTVLVVQSVPLAYLTAAAGLATRAEPDLERAARAAGATGWTALRTVTLPLLRPALSAGAVLVFVTTVNAFGVPAVLGRSAGVVTVTTQIYSDLVFAADPAAFTRVVVLATGLVLLTVTVVGLGDVAEGLRGGAVRTGAPAGGVTPGRHPRWTAAALWGWVITTTAVPVLALAAAAVTRAVGLPPVPANWTLEHFRAALAGTGGAALGRSLLLATAAASAVVALGALLTALRNRPGGRALATVTTLTFAVPGSALAVAVLLAYGGWLRDTLLLILVAYLAKFLALGHRPLAGAVDGLPPELTWAARVSGARPLTTLRTVTVPLLRAALAVSWLVVFLFALHEVTLSSLLYGPGSETLAVVILNLRQLGDVPVTAALAVLLTALVVVVATLLSLVRRAAAGTPARGAP